MRLNQSQLENASEIKSAAGRRQRVSVLQMELVNCHPWSIGDGISITCNVHSTRCFRGVEMGWKISETACNRNLPSAIICNKTLFHCGPCSKASPKSLVNEDFNAYERNVPATLFLDLAVAISVYFALFSRHLTGHNAAGSHGVLIRARQVQFSLSH